MYDYAWTTEEIVEIIKSLEYAIEEADGWSDDSRGCPVKTPEMDIARAIVKKYKSLLQISFGAGICLSSPVRPRKSSARTSRLK